ncbi:MAG: hypothetical protein H6916_05855 [Novosphingobium sp.]|uniref:hypothetical protein n=1 Tax=Novosphingobium sp. TaxID=1874826 RepID=UPI002632EA91|nr:hypothetical protein [Novosphingobium sp.]MCP5386327.1 hypothetical protein [Novosphingobium sp.]
MEKPGHSNDNISSPRLTLALWLLTIPGIPLDWGIGPQASVAAADADSVPLAVDTDLTEQNHRDWRTRQDSNLWPLPSEL